ncbi:MAG: T9SS-dependent M36 family metallopeptidase [Bacteroidota bacterium]
MKHKLFLMAFSLLAIIAHAQTDFLPVIRQQLLLKGFSASDIEQVVVTNQYTSKQNGITHIYFRQKYNGIELYNAVGALHIRKNEIISTNQSFVNNIAAKVTTQKAGINANNAIAVTAQHLNLKEPAALAKAAYQLKENKLSVTDVSVSPEPIQVQLYYYVVNNEVKLVYNTNWLDASTNNWWNVRVDASNGEVIDKNNWALSCTNHEHKSWNEQAAPASYSARHVYAANQLAKKAGEKNRYHAFPLGIESPLHGNRQLLADPSDSLASPFKWHDIDGVEGAEETITSGNNVFAGEDINNMDQPGYSPDGGDSLIFDYSYDTAATPEYNLDAVITNLFVWNNFMHDVMYHYGFDEESGNFQANNYTRGGEEGDEVRADAQDGSGTNNANFTTPPDGQNPRMQMYLWNTETPYFVFTNDTLADSTTYYVSAFGQRKFDKITGQLALAKELSSSSSLACNPIEDVTGKIVVIDRGTCNYIAKVKTAQNAGAIAAIVINSNNATAFSMTGNDASITIPSIMISKAKGDKLKQWLASGSFNGILRANKVEKALDSDMDNGVISHEYGHGVSSRLTGGPANSNCLNNQEQAGEGWSDFFCLFMTHKETGLAGHARGIGTWLDNEPITGVGIRNFRYSTDMTVNPMTYNSIKTAAIPHGVGSVWCTMLYDLYWNMIDKYGYSTDLYNGKGGNNRTLQLVIDGLKLQPCSPGFVDARDAILLADKMNNNGADSALIWSTFARRGLGYSAKQGASTSRTDGTEAFDMPAPSTGLFQINKLSNISFWPNPNNGNFELSLPENVSQVNVYIYDISGKQVYSRQLTGSGKVSVESNTLQNGLYILKAESNGAVYSNKLIIAH